MNVSNDHKQRRESKLYASTKRIIMMALSLQSCELWLASAAGLQANFWANQVALQNVINPCALLANLKAKHQLEPQPNIPSLSINAHEAGSITNNDLSPGQCVLIDQYVTRQTLVYQREQENRQNVQRWHNIHRPCFWSSAHCSSTHLCC